MFDSALNRQAIKILMMAPLLYMTVGFWMFNNRQIFHNEVIPLKTINDHMNTRHSPKYALRVDHSTPLLIFLGLLLVLMLAKDRAIVYMRKLM